MLTTEQNLTQLHGAREHQDSALSDDEKWKAVLSRNDRFDGAFVFAVRSTRIYCRPSCPARRPTKEHVTFYSGSNEAEQSGFRPCHRCHPREVGPSPKRSEEHTSELQSLAYLVCRLLLEKKKSR